MTLPQPGERISGILTRMTGMEDAADLPDWAYEGAKIIHSTFGPGTVTFVGPYKGVPACSVQFEGHMKALELQYAIPHVRLAEDIEPEPPKKRGWFRG